MIDFKKKPIFGMIHLAGQDQYTAVQRAIEEMLIYQECGVNGVIIENYHGDAGWIPDLLELMTTYIFDDLYIGINILPNEFKEAIVFADLYGADFVQLDHVAGVYGNQTVNVRELTEVRKRFPKVEVLGGVWPKYYTPAPNSNLDDDIKAGMERADAIVVTGEGTGRETPLDKIKKFRRITGEFPLIIGAGMDVSNAAEQIKIADGAIVGSCFKPFKRTHEMVSRTRVLEFMAEVNKGR